METITTEQKKKGVALEIKDLLAGAAFPFMLMLILSATIMSYIAYGGSEDLGLQILILTVGEILLIAATVIFGKQNGVSAYKRTVQNAQKREAGSTEVRALLRVGDYAIYKGVIIALISCLPFIIIEFIYAVFPNDVCRFMLMYVFGWAYYPFALASLSPWLNFLWVIVFVAIHTGAYIWGGKLEKKRQEAIEKQSETQAKFNKK